MKEDLILFRAFLAIAVVSFAGAVFFFVEGFPDAVGVLMMGCVWVSIGAYKKWRALR